MTQRYIMGIVTHFSVDKERKKRTSLCAYARIDSDFVEAIGIETRKVLGRKRNHASSDA
jgi:hypothetical protein